MSLYDFYMYLKYIEYSEENLEFYMWYVLMPCACLVSGLTGTRFKNYEATFAKSSPTMDKDYGSIPSAAQSTSSVAQIRPGDSLASMDKLDPEDDEDSEAGMPIYSVSPLQRQSLTDPRQPRKPSSTSPS
jgi:hypothetical protein